MGAPSLVCGQGTMTDKSLTVFENYHIRRHYDEQTDIWYFSVVDIVQALIQQPDYQTARKYWNKLKERLRKEGSESVTKCNRLKMETADGKKYLTDATDPETLLRLIQSVPSPKAEQIKLWLAKVGYERLQDMGDPARSLYRAREQRITGPPAEGRRRLGFLCRGSSKPRTLMLFQAGIVGEDVHLYTLLGLVSAGFGARTGVDEHFLCFAVHPDRFTGQIALAAENPGISP